MANWTKIGAIVSIATLVLIVYIFLEPRVFTPEPNLTVNITTEIGILEGNPLQYTTRGPVYHGEEREIFYIKVTNEGGGNAHNITIALQTNGYVDFNNVCFTSECIPCRAKVGECWVAVLPAGSSESFQYFITIRPEHYDKVLNSEEPEIKFTITYDELTHSLEIPIMLKFRP